ncbi:hypothetical protein AB0J72_57845 [Dactylosporangium sp. NPDC049742]|uniref:hypothetical protein n=1 Tax=Dactylosporangium sp. NPDC049742 TaxID=3154737 RepID=UPI00342CF1E4
MKRRALLVAGGAFAGTFLGERPGGRAAQAVVQWPMFEWEKQRGFFPPGVGVMVPPPLAVYGDGEAYADAAAHQYLPAGEAEALRTHAVQVLGKRADLRRRPGFEPSEDAPSERVRVRTADGHYLTAHLDGWGDGDPQHAFPAALHELYDHVQVLRRRVRADGTPWAADALLLVAVHLDAEPDDAEPDDAEPDDAEPDDAEPDDAEPDDGEPDDGEPDDPEPWPASVPVPDVRHDRPYRETKLTGAKARRVRRDLPRSDEGAWRSYRTPAGAFIAVAWRYSLPHEW